MASQIHRLAEANAELALKSSEPPADGMAHALPNGHGPVHSTTQLPGEANPSCCLNLPTPWLAVIANAVTKTLWQNAFGGVLTW